MVATSQAITTLGPGLIADRISTAAALLDSVQEISGGHGAKLDITEVGSAEVLLELARRGWRIEYTKAASGNEWYSARLGDEGERQHDVSWFPRGEVSEERDRLDELAGKGVE